MSFPRAVIKRFNETADTTIPAPGTYDPRFMTDVAVVSTLKGVEKGSRHNNGNGKTRSEDIDPSAHLTLGRIVSRTPSFTKRVSASTVGSDLGKRVQSSVQTAPTARPRLRSSSVVTNGQKQSLHAPPFPSSTHYNKPTGNPEMKATPEKNKQDEGESSRKTDEDMVCQDVMTRIQEIQTMAESLQVEVSEYKRRLTDELMRNQELEAKKLELDFTIQTLRREIGKHETAKEAWQLGEKYHNSEVDQLKITITELEQEISDLRAQCETQREVESGLRVKISTLEAHQATWQAEREEYEETLQKSNRLAKIQESKISEAEGKNRELISQMDSCYQMCESRMADAENMREVYEVKVQELGQEKEALRKELENVSRQLETETTLVELMKSEQQANANVIDTGKGAYIN